MTSLTFGQYLRTIRKQSGISQRNLAEQAQVDFTYISKIENGHVAPPSKEVLERFACILETDENKLILAAGKIPHDLKSMMCNNSMLTELVRVLSEQRLPDHVYYQMLQVVPKEEKV